MPSLKRPVETFGKAHFAELLAQGLTVPQIRDRMGLSNGMAQNYMTRIRRDLGVPAKD